MPLRCVLFFVLLTAALGQEAKEGSAGDARRVVTIRRITVQGTRLPTLSVIGLAQIKAGDQMNFDKLRRALQKVTASGLISNIDFDYESLPDRETDVVLHLKCTDVKATAKASMQIPKVNEEDVWNWLGQMDALFTREMPANEAAIRLYSHGIGKYLESHGYPKFDENFAVVAYASSSTGENRTDRLIFKVVKRRGGR
jgi:outer membrane protein assembly factor BamA